MNTTKGANSPTIHRITPDCQPVFPCWLWLANHSRWARRSLGFAEGESLDHMTHWHPDQPAAPAVTPGAPIRIVAAAVIHGGVVHTAPHHHLAMWQISCCWGEKANGEQGFVASDGKFYGREESYQIAKAAGQIKFPLPYQHDDLYSEELWSYADWLKERKMGDSPDAAPAPGQGETPRTDTETLSRMPNHVPVSFARTLERELAEAKRRLEEQHKLYCEETKRHNETWAKIHAATGHLNKEFKNLPEDLVEAVKEVTFRVALVEMGRDTLRQQLAAVTKERDEHKAMRRHFSAMCDNMANELAALRIDRERYRMACVMDATLHARVCAWMARAAIDAARQQEGRG